MRRVPSPPHSTAPRPAYLREADAAILERLFSLTLWPSEIEQRPANQQDFCRPRESIPTQPIRRFRCLCSYRVFA